MAQVDGRGLVGVLLANADIRMNMFVMPVIGGNRRVVIHMQVQARGLDKRQGDDQIHGPK